MLYIHLNYNCNLDCSFCASDATCRAKSKIDTVEVIDNTDYASLDGEVVHISGGEPTIVANLPKIIEKFKRQNAIVYLSSNLIRLSNKKYLDELISAGLDAIAFSLFTTLEEEFNRLTRSRLFGSWVNAINKISQTNLILIPKVLFIDTLMFKQKLSINTFLTEHNIRPTEVQLSGLHISNKVLKNSRNIICSPDTLKNYLNHTYKDLMGHNIYIQEIPLCYLDVENLEHYLSNGVLRNSHEFYFDKIDSTGFNTKSLVNNYFKKCQTCDIRDACSVLNPRNISTYCKMGYQKELRRVMIQM